MFGKKLLNRIQSPRRQLDALPDFCKRDAVQKRRVQVITCMHAQDSIVKVPPHFTAESSTMDPFLLQSPVGDLGRCLNSAHTAITLWVCSMHMEVQLTVACQLSANASFRPCKRLLSTVVPVLWLPCDQADLQPSQHKILLWQMCPCT